MYRLLFAATVLCTTVAHSQTLTAVCKSPKGTTVVAGDKLVSEPDGFGDGVFTYSWKQGSKTATIISQSGVAAGGVPSTEDATAVEGEGFVTFVVRYDRAVWIHSLYPQRRVVLMSRHVNSLTRGAAVGGLYTATCSMATQ